MTLRNQQGSASCLFFTTKVTFLSSKLILDKFDEDLFTEWMKNPHYYHSFYIYDGYNHYNSQWNSFLQRITGKAICDDTIISKLIEANLEYLQVKKGVDIAKKFTK